MEENIKVSVRVRPLNAREKDSGDSSCILVDGPNISINGGLAFCFDHVFDTSSSNEQVYREQGSDVVSSVLAGFNGTIFAYGQTSSGKTHTMQGTEWNRGIIYRAVDDIFAFIRKTPQREFLLRISYMEIYNEIIRDLLDSSSENLKIKIDSSGVPYVGELKERLVVSPSDIFQWMEEGQKNRTIGKTDMNEYSSRSHSIFRIVIESRERSSEELNEEEVDGGILAATLTLVDLAGSERIRHTNTSGSRLKEGGHINKSLMTLGTVINKLCQDSVHIPYRDSKLTHILQPSLGGNARTAIICTITPALMHSEETLTTLKFANRAKDIRNEVKINEILDERTLIQRLKREINSLKTKLRHSGGSVEERDPSEGIEEKLELYKKAFVMSDSFSLSNKKSNRRKTVLGSTFEDNIGYLKKQDQSNQLFISSDPFSALLVEGKSKNKSLQTLKDLSEKLQSVLEAARNAQSDKWTERAKLCKCMVMLELVKRSALKSSDVSAIQLQSLQSQFDIVTRQFLEQKSHCARLLSENQSQADRIAMLSAEIDTRKESMQGNEMQEEYFTMKSAFEEEKKKCSQLLAKVSQFDELQVKLRQIVSELEKKEKQLKETISFYENSQVQLKQVQSALLKEKEAHSLLKSSLDSRESDLNAFHQTERDALVLKHDQEMAETHLKLFQEKEEIALELSQFQEMHSKALESFQLASEELDRLKSQSEHSSKSEEEVLEQLRRVKKENERILKELGQSRDSLKAIGTEKYEAVRSLEKQKNEMKALEQRLTEQSSDSIKLAREVDVLQQERFQLKSTIAGLLDSNEQLKQSQIVLSQRNETGLALNAKLSEQVRRLEDQLESVKSTEETVFQEKELRMKKRVEDTEKMYAQVIEENKVLQETIGRLEAESQLSSQENKTPLKIESEKQKRIILKEMRGYSDAKNKELIGKVAKYEMLLRQHNINFV